MIRTTLIIVSLFLASCVPTEIDPPVEIPDAGPQPEPKPEPEPEPMFDPCSQPGSVTLPNPYAFSARSFSGELGISQDGEWLVGFAGQRSPVRTDQVLTFELPIIGNVVRTGIVIYTGPGVEAQVAIFRFSIATGDVELLDSNNQTVTGWSVLEVIGDWPIAAGQWLHVVVNSSEGPPDFCFRGGFVHYSAL